MTLAMILANPFQDICQAMKSSGTNDDADDLF